jgi:hypothetical protein
MKKLWQRIGELSDSQINKCVLAVCLLITAACAVAVFWCCVCRHV